MVGLAGLHVQYRREDGSLPVELNGLHPGTLSRSSSAGSLASYRIVVQEKLTVLAVVNGVHRYHCSPAGYASHVYPTIRELTIVARATDEEPEDVVVYGSYVFAVLFGGKGVAEYYL